MDDDVALVVVDRRRDAASQCTSPWRSMVTLASFAFTETVLPASLPVPTMVAEPAQLVVLVVNVAAAGPAMASTLPPLKTAAATSRTAHRRRPRGCDVRAPACSGGRAVLDRRTWAKCMRDETTARHPC